MKKQLLLGSVLLTAVTVLAQNTQRIKASGIANYHSIAATQFSDEVNSSNYHTSQAIGPVQNLNEVNSTAKETAVASTGINWKLLCGSTNITGMLVSHSRPLQYNNDVNAVSFVHRKSASYQTNPVLPTTAQSGVVVAEISTNWGVTFDSTALWSNATNWSRYVQGGIYNSLPNTNIANAYIVGSGPVVNSSGFSGDFYASKQLGTYNNVASTTLNAQQFLSFSLASYPSNQQAHSWSRYGFSCTDDGAVRSLALIENNSINPSSTRGVSLVKGIFNAGVFSWVTDSITPFTVIQSNGGKVLSPVPQMAWNEAGTVGYAVIMGALNFATNSNKGYQPIIYKTTTSGNTWSLIQSIDFNAPSASQILNHLAPIQTNTSIAVPYFNDFDIVVDVNNNLHIGATLMSTASNHNDSLNYVSQFSMSVNPTDLYYWPHVPGHRPYLYDFIGDGSAPWQVVTIDSLSTEAASAYSNGNGYSDNPWQASSSVEPLKVDDVDSRIQLGRTPDGAFITFSWAESDTNFTNYGKKFNNLPNIKARCMAIGTGTNMYEVSPTEINVTKVAAGTGTANANVALRATLHYMSPTTGAASIFTSTATYTTDIYTPFTVTNSNPLNPSTNNITWYQNGKLSYAFTGTATATSTLITVVNKNTLNNSGNSIIYPNPASNNAVLSIGLETNSNVGLVIFNAIGQVVKTVEVNGQPGENNISIDLSNLSNGIYIVNIKVDDITSTKKLIIQ